MAGFKNKPCLIEHCQNNGRARVPICANCQSALHRADVKGSTWILDRQNTLEKWQDRMQYLGSRDRSYRNVARKIANRRGLN